MKKWGYIIFPNSNRQFFFRAPIFDWAWWQYKKRAFKKKRTRGNFAADGQDNCELIGHVFEILKEGVDKKKVNNCNDNGARQMEEEERN